MWISLEYNRKIITTAFTVVIFYLTSIYVTETNGLTYLHMKKLATLALLAKALRPDLIPLPIPMPMHMGKMPYMKSPEPMIKPIFIPVPVHHYHTSHKIIKSAASPTKHVILTAPSFSGFGSKIYGGIGSQSLYPGTMLSSGHGGGVSYADSSNYIESESGLRPMYASKPAPSGRNQFSQAGPGGFLPMAAAASYQRPRIYLQDVTRYMHKMPAMSMPSMPSMPSIPSMPSMPSIPSMPSMPSIPSMPSMPSMPPMPTFSGGFKPMTNFQSQTPSSSSSSSDTSSEDSNATSASVSDPNGPGSASAGGYLSNVPGKSAQASASSSSSGAHSSSSQSSSSASMSSDGTASSDSNSIATYKD